MDGRRILTRRNFTRSAAVASIGFAVGQGRSAPEFHAAQQGRPPWRPADGLRLAGSVQGLASLDPALARDLSTNFLLRQLFRSLVGFDAALRPVPELAEAITISDDGLTYHVGLRPTARFHDGRAIEAEDIIESLSRAVRPATGGGDAASLPGRAYLGDIEGADAVLAGVAERLSGVVAIDPGTVEITLTNPSATFLMKLASVPASIVDRQQSRVDLGEDVVNGSGPFRLTSWERGESIRFSAAETWWGGRPAVPTIDIRIGASASQPLNLYQAGEIDLVDEVPPDQVPLVADPASGIERGDLIQTDLFAVSYIALGNIEPPLDDFHVRRAIKLAFPAENVASAMFNGAVRGADGLIPDGMLQTIWDGGPSGADVSAANDALAQSRYGRAEQVPPIPVYGADVAPLEALRDSTRERIGLRFDVVSVNWPDFLIGLAARRFPAYALYWGVDYPDPENLLWTLFGSDSPENYTGYHNPDFDAAMANARTVQDQTQRAAIYAAAHQMLLEDVAVIPLYFDRQTTIVRPGVDGLQVTPMGILRLETIETSS